MSHINNRNTLSSPEPYFMYPNWSAPSNVRAAITTRRSGGVSDAPYNCCNLGDHVGDNPDHVAANRAFIRQALQLPSEPYWLKQVHGVQVLTLDQPNTNIHTVYEADASLTQAKNTVCAVMTADCLPVLFCDQTGTTVAAAHAGWRGLHAGVLEATVANMQIPPAQIMAWLGPAIGTTAFEVGDEVRAAFCQVDEQAAQAFQPAKQKQKWYADIFLLARQRLQAIGLTHISGGGLCTYENPQDFYSYRRDKVTGRMASLIWLD